MSLLEPPLVAYLRHEISDQAYYTAPLSAKHAQRGWGEYLDIKGLIIGDSLVIDPCAGGGELTKGFAPHALLFDLKPTGLGIIAKDLFTLTEGDLPANDLRSRIVVANPPFNRGFVYRFFDHMATLHPRVMLLILPDRFRADPEMPHGWRCVRHGPMLPNSFEYQRKPGGRVCVRVSWQVWEPCEQEAPGQPWNTEWLARVDGEHDGGTRPEFFVLPRNPKNCKGGMRTCKLTGPASHNGPVGLRIRKAARKKARRVPPQLITTTKGRPSAVSNRESLLPRIAVSFGEELDWSPGEKRKFLEGVLEEMWEEHPEYTERALRPLDIKIALHKALTIRQSAHR